MNRDATLAKVLKQSVQASTSELGKFQDTSRRTTDCDNCRDQSHELTLVRLVEGDIQEHIARIGRARTLLPAGHHPIFLRRRKDSISLSTSLKTSAFTPKRPAIRDAVDFEPTGGIRPPLPPYTLYFPECPGPMITVVWLSVADF